jgi:small subunit ribosomal protein S7
MRSKRAVKRAIDPDPKYHSAAIAKFINTVMQRGKKTVAQKIVYGAFEFIRAKKQDPIVVFEQAVKNAAPVVEVKSRRIGGANYQVPIEVRGDRRMALAYRWIIGGASNRKGKPMKERLALELLDASENTGEAVKKKLDVQRMAEANRAFAHFA